MSDIEFRAWDKRYGVMVHLRSWNFAHGHFEVSNSEIPDKYPIEEDLEIMQYTGLKDKNDKKIFEGDIVGMDKSICIGAFSELKIDAGDVFFDDGCFWVRQEISVLAHQICEVSAVIGNVHENPELLKKETSDE